VAKDGKFGTYVTDGETNASLTRGDRIEFVTAERAFELLAIRRDYTATNGPSKKRTKKAAKPKKSIAKKTTKSPTAKKTVKKTVKKAKTGAKVAVAADESTE
jgi:DNA topoisomerase-1